MPEYLAPGVYIEETSFRAKTIEGVSTSTAGFIGPARFGPTEGVPELLTSFADFERIYGSIDPIEFGDDGETPNYLAHAVRAFFDNGGKRLYVSRVYDAPDGAPSVTPPSGFTVPAGHAWASLVSEGSPPAEGQALLVARFPGSGGNIEVTFTLRLGQNIFIRGGPGERDELRGALAHDVVVINPGATPLQSPSIARVLRNSTTRQWQFLDDDGNDVTPSGGITDVRVLTFGIEVRYPPPVPRPGAIRTEVWEGLSFDPRHERSWDKKFGPTLATRALSLTIPFYILSQHDTPPNDDLEPLQLAQLLLSRELEPGPGGTMQFRIVLSNGQDGDSPEPTSFAGDDADPKRKSGLKSFEDLANISILAAPGSTRGGTRAQAIANHLITHCELMRYRIAVLDSVNEHRISDVLSYRARFDSTHAALYYPWVRIVDPVTDRELDLPPSGFVAGIYARNDIEKGVHKAPANEVVRDAIDFEVLLNKSQQDVLNPEGVNCFRYFEGRGYRLWGARLISSDQEWKYVNLRRYFAYLERSIERGTQWVVFENNSEALWANVRRTVEDFLYNEWKSGHLMGTKPEEAYFVRCDRSTMTQNDIDNGRLICLIGVAPVRPAEFVIFRIGQWTATAKQ